MMDLAITVETSKPRVTFVATGELDGAAFRARMESWLAGAPGSFEFDRLYDLRSYAGTVSHDDVRHVGRLMRAAGADEDGGRTVFVSLDRGFALWACSIQLELPRRPMVVVKTLNEAEAVLAEPR